MFSSLCSASTRAFLRANSLTILTIASVVAAIVTGVVIREYHPEFKATFTPRVLASVMFVGDLFLQMLRCLILPLIVTSLICAIGNLNAKLNKFIGGYGVLYYMSTTLLAIILGIIMAMSIRPGQRYQRESTVGGDSDLTNTTATARTNALENLFDLVRNMFPENPVQATLEQYKTVLKKPDDPLLASDHDQWIPSVQMEKSMNILGVVIMSVFVGVALSQVNSRQQAETKAKRMQRKRTESEIEIHSHNSISASGLTQLSSVETLTMKALPESSIEDVADENVNHKSEKESLSTDYKLEPEEELDNMVFLRFVNEANEIFMKLVNWVICLSPIGIFFLILGKILETDNLIQLLDSLSFYALCVLGGIFIHAVFVLPSILWVFTRQNPFTVIRGMGQALLMAFGTSSSSATLPVTMKCLKELGDRDEKLRIDERVINFILPIGATINMDGTALYEAVAAIFISQLNNVEMTPLSIITICLTATLGSVGAAGIPQAGLITLIIVLDTLGLPISDITVIITIDWLLDRFRTVCNVLGDSIGCVIISKRAKFDEMDKED